ncbi:Bug family tripartite tricarboxylate transporter substrate binding protein [Advenella kashmirensis]|nr:tripartite tricarboxylate transporter substrate-binding protein [Advenella kashmirensis]
MTMLLLALAGALFNPGLAGAQPFPSKPIRMIVPVPPGGSGDLVSRLVAGAAAEDLQQPIVIDNRPGATGNIGTVAAVKAPADGYTIFLCSIGNCSVNASLYANPALICSKTSRRSYCWVRPLMHLLPDPRQASIACRR